ncbi:hypothetical protein PENVUL_c010G04165 [Penicillium vulpinum]|uniref:Uncharacterized protein n=2 Tax=Penicillium vulpinum TaxID=29845 RepID=A0A1V6S2V1_9EURO|nr:hypothetical protein PENVUL_c010G04165 [Penicillium vulpinum]
MSYLQAPPTYEESTQNAMKRFTNEVLNVKVPAELLEPLLSDKLSIDEKQKLIEQAPDIVFTGDGGIGITTPDLEDRLENANYDELAQMVAYRYHLLTAASNRDWCKELIELDITLRWILQRRIWFEQKKNHIPPSDLHQLEANEKQIKSLNSRYWDTHREQWIKSDNICSKTARRAIRRQKKHADWYLSAVLREDCAKRGGCCGRKCGCRERSRITGGNIDGVRDQDHCTTACGCCLEVHGIDGEDLEMKDVDEIHFTTTDDHHTLRLLKGYIFYLNGMECKSTQTRSFAYTEHIARSS